MAEDKPIPEAEMQAAPRDPKVRDHRGLPEGVVPKQAQGYVIAGLAVLILLAVLFSKNHARLPAKDGMGPSLASSTDMNQKKIEELEQDLTTAQQQGQQAQKTGMTQAATTAAAPTSTAPLAAPQLAPEANAARDPIADAERELEFKSRFSSNLVSKNVPTDADALRGYSAADASAARPTVLPQNAAAAQAAFAKKSTPEVNVNSAHGRPYVVFEGTTIDTALVNRLDGDFAGPVKVMVTDPIYSQDRQHVLIPAGTFLLGSVEKVAGFGQKRLAVTFHRLLMSDGYSVDLNQFHGLDQGGDTGLKDKVNNHYLEIFGTSIALGVISGAAEATTNSGYNQSGADMYQQGIASSLSQSSANVLDRFINVPPSITILEGHRIKVYLTQDILLPAYENHTVPGDI